MSMKQFDADSIRSRMLETLKTYIDPSDDSKLWRRILNDSAIQSLLLAIAEDTAESARYFEYLLKEAMWSTRKNRSSAVQQMSLFGYQPHRKISAIGEIYVSHDPLFAGAGQTLFLKIDEETGAESFVDYNGNVIHLSTYASLTDVILAKGTKVTTGSITFVTTEARTYAHTHPLGTVTILDAPTSAGTITLAEVPVTFTAEETGLTPGQAASKIKTAISNSNTCLWAVVNDPADQSAIIQLELKDVTAEVPELVLVDDPLTPTGILSYISVSEGTQYMTIPVIQGVQRTVVSDKPAVGTPLEVIKIPVSNIEAALDDNSSWFFQVSVSIGGADPIAVEVIEDILLAEPTQLACHVRTADDFSYITLTFGDGLTGRLLPAGSVVYVTYLETLGVDGNILEDNAITSFVLPNGLYCTNFTPLQGGKDNETLESIRELGPQYYLLGDRSIITEDAYVANIEAVPGVMKAAVSSRETTEGGVVQKAIYFTGFGTDGRKLVKDDIEDKFSAATVERRSPLDYIVYEDPNPLLMNIGVTASTTSMEVDPTTVESEVANALVTAYNLEVSEFGNSFDSSAWSKLVLSSGSAYNLENVEILPEAVIELLPSEFLVSTNPTKYYHAFEFDTAFEEMKDLTMNPYCLKVQILFLCEGCTDNSRTLLVRADEDGDPVVKQYYYVDKVTTSSYVSNSLGSEILASDEDFIEFDLTFEYDTFPRLYPGHLSIPLKKKNGNDYLNFTLGSTDTLDSAVSIKVMALPLTSYGSAIEYKDIFYTDENSVQVEVRVVSK